MQEVPVTLAITNLLDFIDGALIYSVSQTVKDIIVFFIENLQSIKDGIVSFIAILLSLLVLFFIVRIIYFVSTESKEIVILPFEVSSSKIYNGKTISDSLIAEMEKIKNVLEYHYEEENDIWKFEIGDVKIDLPIFTPVTNKIDSKISSLGDINVAGINISMLSIVTVFRLFWPFGEQAKTIRGNLQEYDSEIHLTALMESPRAHVWNIDTKLEQTDKEDILQELIKDLAFMIIYDLSEVESDKEGKIAKTWISLKYYIKALDSYYKYTTTKKLEYLENARTNCTKALREDKDFVNLFNLLYNIGISYLNTEDYYFAEDLFRLCVTLKPFEVNGFFGLAISLMKLDQKEEALEVINVSLNRNDKSAITWYNKGLILSKLGQDIEAIRAFEKSLEVNPNDPITLFHLGLAHSSIYKYEKSLDAFNESLKLDPDNVDVLHFKGLSYICLGQYGEALKVFENAQRINQKDAENWYLKGNYYSDRDHFYESLKAFENAQEIDQKDAKNWYWIGISHLKLGHWYESLKAFESSRKINQRVNETLYWIIDYYCSIRCQYNEASRAHDSLKKIAKEDATTLYYMCDSYIYRHQYDNALTNYLEALKIYPNPMDMGDKDIFFKIACCYSLMNDKDNALKYLSHSVELNPSYTGRAKRAKAFEKLWEDNDFKKIVTVSQDV